MLGVLHLRYVAVSWDVFTCNDRYGQTALHVAAAEGRVDFLRQLLKHGADPHATNSERGHTPLHEAARGGHAAAVAVLV